MSSTEEKLASLSERYPLVEESTLLEILVACEGSIEQANLLLGGYDEKPLKKTKTGRPKLQSSINSFVKTSGCKSALQIDSPAKSNKKIIRLYTPEEVSKHLFPYVSLHRTFLDDNFSNELLKHICKHERKYLKNHEFYLFNKLCHAEHESALLSRSAIQKDTFYNGKKISSPVYSDNVEKAAQITEEFINNVVLKKQTNCLKFQFSKPGTWASDKCVINYYGKGSNHLDWHSDRLNYIGPHCLIASISLGATREFRLRRNYNNVDLSNDPTTIYSIIAPHNSLIVMHPGCQEEYKHCVPLSTSPLETNEISGSSRYNLTFRHFPATFNDYAPSCKCGVRMMLRRSYKEISSRGKYFWTCERTYENKGCGEFHWTDFSNKANNFKSSSEENVSVWIAPDDYAKQKYCEQLGINDEF